MGKGDNCGDIDKIREEPRNLEYIRDFFSIPKASAQMPDIKFLQTADGQHIVSSVLSFFGQKLFELAQSWKDLDATNVSLLNDPDFQRVFYEKLAFIMSEKVANRTPKLLDELFASNQTMNKLYPFGYKDRLLHAAILSFVIHYGDKRDGENDYDHKTGEELPNVPLDYIRHPLRVGLVEMDDRNVGRIDEATAALGFYHDIFENFHNGFFKLLNVPHGEASQMLPYIRGYMNLCQSPALNDAGVLISDLIEPIGAEKNEKISRQRRTITMFHDICSKLDEPKKFLQYLRDIVVKDADRSNNGKTSEFLKTRRPGSFEAMMDETLYNYIPLSDALGMVSALDSLLDFYHITDRREWQEFANKDKDRRKMLDIENIFRSRVAEEINSRLPDDKFEIGKDYNIFFRPRALRHRKEAISKTMQKESIERMSEQQLKAMSRAFLNYVIFYPLTEDPALREKLVGVARNVFDDMFKPSHGLADKYEHDRKTQLGSMFTFASDEGVKSPEGKEQVKFGAVVHKIFNSPEAMKKDMHGLIHSLLICGDKDAETRVFKLFREIKKYVDNLKNQLDILDKALAVSEEDLTADSKIAGVRGKILSVMGEAERVSRIDISLHEILAEADPKILKILIALVERKILALFAKPIKVDFRIIQEKEDRNVIKNFGAVEIPKGSSAACALLHLAPHCLLYEIKRCCVKCSKEKSETFEGSEALNCKMRNRMAVDIFVSDIKPHLDEQSGNIEAAAENLDDSVLKPIRNKYLKNGRTV